MHELFQTRVSKRRDVPWDVLGQSVTGCHVVPLSWDKKVSLFRCPFALGQKNSVTELMGKTEDDFVPQDVPGWDGTASNNHGPVLWQDLGLSRYPFVKKILSRWKPYLKLIQIDK